MDRANPSRLSMKSGLNSLIALTTPAVKKFFGWVRSEEDERWAKKAEQLLYKKLGKKKEAIEELERALSCPGTPSECVTIEVNLDCRIQVLHRKVLPHYVSCRLWRWPDLETPYELKAIKSCQHPFSKRKTEICINPYHYERVAWFVSKPKLSSNSENTFTHSQQSLTQSVRSNIPGYVSYAENSVTSPMFIPSMQSSFGSITSNYPQPNGNLSENESPLSETLSNTDTRIISEILLALEKILATPSDRPCTSRTHQEKPSWASISYYELNQRVGQTFRVYSDSVFVDGFTNPDRESNRFCLGSLNNEHRNSTIENTRKHIGRGVHLYNENGKVYVGCLSERALFLQSEIFNYQRKDPPSTVHKITHGSSMCVFNNLAFAEILTEYVYHGFEAVYNLTKMCSIKISFVKGWGSNYHRQDITSTPCWIEIQLFKPLMWLDKVLVAMGGPNTFVNSVS